MLNNFFFFPENRAVCEILWKNVVEPDESQTTTWRMRVACWIPKATNTHSEYVFFLYGSNRQTKALLRYVRKVRDLLAFVLMMLFVCVCVFVCVCLCVCVSS